MIAGETEYLLSGHQGSFDDFLGIGKGRKKKKASGDRSSRKASRKAKRQNRRTERKIRKGKLPSPAPTSTENPTEKPNTRAGFQNTVNAGLNTIQDVKQVVGDTRQIFQRPTIQEPVNQVDQASMNMPWSDPGSDSIDPPAGDNNNIVLLLVGAAIVIGGYYWYQNRQAA